MLSCTSTKKLAFYKFDWLSIEAPSEENNEYK